MADQKLMKKRLKALMDQPGNQVCSDCTERQPRWASLIVPPPGAPPGSLPIGAFCCLECSGSHRRLGVHISFVRSINLDSWKEKEVQAMENGGNVKVNAIFEAHLDVDKPTNHADLNTRERFIRDKYERRKFYDASVFQKLEREAAAAPPPAAAPPQQQRQQTPEEDLDFPDMSSGPRDFSDFGSQNTTGTVGAPSAAARRRLEARKIERSDTSSSTQARAAAPRVGAPPAVRKPGDPTGDLLDFNDPAEPQRGVARRKSNDLMGFSSDEDKDSKTKLTRKKSAEGKRPQSKTEDEFASFAAASGGAPTDFGDFKDFGAPATNSPKKPAPAPAPAKKSAQDIMSLYNASASTPVFGANGMNAPNPMLNSQNLAQMTAMMHQLNLNNSLVAQQQAQVQQQALMYQQHMMRLKMQAQQQGMMGGNPMAVGMNPGMMGMGVAPMNMPTLLQTQARPNPSPMTTDGKAAPGIGLASMHSVESAASGNGDVDPFASLTGRQGFR